MLPMAMARPSSGVVAVRYVAYFWAIWRHVSSAAVTLLQRPFVVQANASATSYYLRRVLDDGGLRDQTSRSCKGCGGKSLWCSVALLLWQRGGASAEARYQCAAGEFLGCHNIPVWYRQLYASCCCHETHRGPHWLHCSSHYCQHCVTSCSVLIRS